MDLGPVTLGATLRRFAIGALDVVIGVLDCIAYAARMIRATAFWGSILLPFVIVAGMVTDIATTAPLYLALLVGLNVVCLLLSRGYRPDA